MQYTFGALAPLKDMRDYLVKTAQNAFPQSYQISYLPEVKDQGAVSSCVPHALAAILEILEYQESKKEIKLSTDFIYGIQEKDTPGMRLRDACKIAKTYGDCLRETLPSNTEHPETPKPNEAQIEEAKTYKVKSYAQCKSESAIKYAIMNYSPILASVNWYDNKIDENNVIHMNEAISYGRHAIVIYGWNAHGWLCRNSWGTAFGKEGNFIYPFEGSFNEAWAFVDAANEDVKTKHNSCFWNFIYKIINAILNKGRVK